MTGSGVRVLNRVMTTAHATFPAHYPTGRLSELRAEWTGALDLAREYLWNEPDALVLIARHRVSGRWAATDLGLNPDAARDPSWNLHITVTRASASKLRVQRISETPCGAAVWCWSRLPGVSMRGWIVDRAATPDHVLAVLESHGYVMAATDEVHWIACTGGVPA